MMNTLDTILAFIGLFVLIPSLTYLFVYSVLETMVSYKKIKTMKRIETDVKGVSEKAYDIPKSLLNKQEKLNENKAFSYIGGTIGTIITAIPLLHIFLEFLKESMPKLV